jgi:hypothetical protein
VNQQRVTAASDFFNKIDPELPFKVGLMNGGMRRNAVNAG